MRKRINRPEVFVDEMLAVTRAIDGGAGVLSLSAMTAAAG
jgi:hypothetical protein